MVLKRKPRCWSQTDKKFPSRVWKLAKRNKLASTKGAFWLKSHHQVRAHKGLGWDWKEHMVEPEQRTWQCSACYAGLWAIGVVISHSLSFKHNIPLALLQACSPEGRTSSPHCACAQTLQDGLPPPPLPGFLSDLRALSSREHRHTRKDLPVPWHAVGPGGRFLSPMDATGFSKTGPG